MATFDHALLLARMRRAWHHGDRLALAWTAQPGLIRVLMVERGAFLALCRARPALWSGRRHHPPASLPALEAELGEAAERVDVVLAGRADEALHARVEKLVERFSIRLHRRRPVALVDLVAFSKCGPIDQLSRLVGLEQALCRAEEGLAAADLAITPMRTTTGDGFYLWDPTSRADSAVRLLALVLATFAHVDRAGFGAEGLKATLGIGACFGFHRVSGQTPQDDTFIVGAVTVEIARLMGGCRPGQILLGTGPDHRRLPTWTDAVAELNPRLEAAAASVGFRLRAHLTGRRDLDGHTLFDRLTVRAKHGWSYPAVNLCGVIDDLHQGAPVALGLARPARADAA